MTKRDYTEFKEQILRECQEVGNVAVVARRHNISPNTIHTWKKSQENWFNNTLLPMTSSESESLKLGLKRSVPKTTD